MSFGGESGNQSQQMKDNMNYTQTTEHRVYGEIDNSSRTPLGRRGRLVSTAENTPNSSTRNRSVKLSLNRRNEAKGESVSVTVQLDNPDEMVENVLQALSSKYPLQTFLESMVTPKQSSRGDVSPNTGENDSSWLEPIKSELIQSNKTRAIHLNKERITTVVPVVLSPDSSEPWRLESSHKSDERVWTISNNNSPSVTNRTETGVNEEMNQSTRITVHSTNGNFPGTQFNQIQFSRVENNLQNNLTHSIKSVDSPIYTQKDTASGLNASHSNLLRTNQSPIYSPESDHHSIETNAALNSTHTIMRQDSASAGNAEPYSTHTIMRQDSASAGNAAPYLTETIMRQDSASAGNAAPYLTHTIMRQGSASAGNAAPYSTHTIMRQDSASAGNAAPYSTHTIMRQDSALAGNAAAHSTHTIMHQDSASAGNAAAHSTHTIMHQDSASAGNAAAHSTHTIMHQDSASAGNSPGLSSSQLNLSYRDIAQKWQPSITMTPETGLAPKVTDSHVRIHENTAAAKMNASQMTSPGMNASQMTSPGMNASQMTSPGMNALQMTSPGMNALQMTSPKMNALQMTSPKMNALQMTSPKMNALQMTSPKINALQMTSPKMNALQMTSPKMNALQMTPPTLDASQTNAPLMNAAAISAWQMNYAHTNDSEAKSMLSRGISETNTSTQHAAQTKGINFLQATDSLLSPDFTHNGVVKLDSSSHMKASDISMGDAVNLRMANFTMNNPSSANPTSGSEIMNAADANQHRKDSSQMTSSLMKEPQTISPGTASQTSVVTNMDVSANLGIKDTSYVDTTMPGNQFYHQKASVAQTVVRNRSPQGSEGREDENRETVMESPQMRTSNDMPKSIISNLSPRMLPFSRMKSPPSGMIVRPARMDASADVSEMFASSIISSSITRSPTTMHSGVTGSATKSCASSYGVPMAGSPLMKLAGSPRMTQCSSPLSLKSSSSFHKMDSPMRTAASRSPQTMATNFAVVEMQKGEPSSEQTSSRVALAGSVETSVSLNVSARSPLIPSSDYNCRSGPSSWIDEQNKVSQEVAAIGYSFGGGNLSAICDSPQHSKATNEHQSTVLQQSATWPSKASSLDIEIGTNEFEQMNSLQSSVQKTREFSSVTQEFHKNNQSEVHHRPQPVRCCSHSSQNHHETHDSVVISCQHDLSNGHVSQKSAREMSNGFDRNESQLDECRKLSQTHRDTQIRTHDRSHHDQSSSMKSNDASQPVNRTGGSVAYTRHGSQHSTTEPKTADGEVRVRGVGEVSRDGIDTSSYGGLLADARLPPPVLSAEGSMSRSDLSGSQNVFEAEGKWETLNEEDVLADKETEHSKSGSRSRMDESSFLESAANGSKIMLNTSCREDWSYETFSALAYKMEANELAQLLLADVGDLNYSKIVSDVSRSLAVSPEVVEKFVKCLNDKPQFRSLCTELVADKVSDVASMGKHEARSQENIQRRCEQDLMEHRLSSMENNWLLGSSHAPRSTEQVPRTEMNNLMSMVTQSPTLRTMLAPDDSVRAFLGNLIKANAYGSAVLVHVSHYLPSLLEDRIPDYLNQYREELAHETVRHIAAAVEAFGGVIEQLGWSPVDLDSELNNLVSRAGNQRGSLTNESESAELSVRMLIHEAVREASLRYAVDRLLRLTMRSNNEHIVHFCENFRRSFNLLEWIWSRVPTAVANFVVSIASGHATLAPVVTRTFVYPTNEPAAYATVTVQREYESPTWSGVCPQQPREILYLERDNSPIRHISDVTSSPLRKIGARVPMDQTPSTYRFVQ